MPQVVTSDNLVELAQTGRVAEFKPPEEKATAPAPDATKPGQDGSIPAATQARDANGKFTKTTDGDTTTPAATPPSTQGEDDDEKDLSEKVRQKIGKQHRLRKEAEEFAKAEWRRAQAAEERAARLQQQLDAQTTRSGPDPSEAPKEPKPDDFKTVAEYTDALVSYRVDQRLREEQTKRERETEQRAREDRQREFGKRIVAAQVKHDDFEEVLNSIKGTDLERVHADVTEYIQESDQGAELLYHLAKNPDVLDRLRKLSPRRFIAELGKLEVTLEPKPAQPPEKAPTLSQVAAPANAPVSRAPAPIVPLDSSGIAPGTKRPEEMNLQELRAYRAQQAREQPRPRN